MRLPRMAVDRCACAGWACTAMVIRGRSVHFGERGGKVEQARGYRRDGIILHVPTVGRRIIRDDDGVGGYEEVLLGVRSDTRLTSRQSAD